MSLPWQDWGLELPFILQPLAKGMVVKNHLSSPRVHPRVGLSWLYLPGATLPVWQGGVGGGGCNTCVTATLSPCFTARLTLCCPVHREK